MLLKCFPQIGQSNAILRLLSSNAVGILVSGSWEFSLETLKSSKSENPK